MLRATKVLDLTLPSQNLALFVGKDVEFSCSLRDLKALFSINWLLKEHSDIAACERNHGVSRVCLLFFEKITGVMYSFPNNRSQMSIAPFSVLKSRSVERRTSFFLRRQVKFRVPSIYL